MDELIQFVVGYCIRRYRNPEDYISAGLHGLSYGLNTYSDKRGDKEYWLKCCALRFIKMCNTHLIRVPKSTRDRYKKKGKELKLPKILPLSKVANIVYEDKRQLEDLIDEIAKDGTDIQIIILRVEGYVDKEISMKLGTSLASVNRRRKIMETRYRERV